MINRDFMRAILSGKKKLLKACDVKRVNIPKFDELSVKRVFPLVKGFPEVMVYLPDSLPKGKLHDRTFFFNILMTVKPEYVQAIVEHANKQRFGCI